MDFKKRYDEMLVKENEAKKLRGNLEREFSEWLMKQENWKMFILSHIRATRSDYPPKDYIYERMSGMIRDLCYTCDGGVRFEIKIFTENMFGTWIDVVLEKGALEDIPGHTNVDNEIVKRRIQEYEEDVKNLEEETKGMIEKKKEEIERLKKWLEQ